MSDSGLRGVSDRNSIHEINKRYQSMTTHPDLDLQGTIRPGLDILANEIIIGLKKRIRFVSNDAIYQPGLVISESEQSLLQYELARIEQCHAELGRYAFTTQDAFSDVSGVQSVLKRTAPESPVKVMASGVGPRIVEFYNSWIQTHCEHADDSKTYGETVTADVVVLLGIMERVNLGKQVAESKFSELTDEFIATGGDREEMLKLIVRRDREQKVIELSKSLARHYELPEATAVSVFEFMIAVTVDIEVDYLRMRISES